MQLIGCDFTSSPSRRKPIVVALGHLQGQQVRLQGLQRFETLQAWGDCLALPGPWVGGFDLPFGLPRELVQTLGWPTDWRACIEHYAALNRDQIRAQFAAFCAQRPPGGKFAHRATDRPAGSSPSMKWVNPPVAFMLHAGLPLLRRAGLHLPGLHEGDRQRVALEAYPGMLARAVLGKQSYKSDTPAKQSPQRLQARLTLLSALHTGLHIKPQAEEQSEPPHPALHDFGPLQLQASPDQLALLANDASGDALDATLCLLQAAWGLQQHQAGHPCYGLPPCDPLEGWIVSA